MATHSHRDPHPQWWAEIMRLEAEQNALMEKSCAIFHAIEADVNAGKISRGGVAIGVKDSRGALFLDFKGRPKGEGVPVFVTTEHEIERTAQPLLNWRKRSRTPTNIKWRRKIKAWVTRKKAELRRSERAYKNALKTSGCADLDKKADVLSDRRWALIYKLADTRARTIEGVQAQAECLMTFFLEESTWAKKTDQKIARNIAKTLAALSARRA